MEQKLDLIKPEFTSEINAKIVTVGQIEDNIKEVKQYALDLNKYYESIVFTPETMKEAVDEKAKVNKFKGKVEEFRKKIVEEYNKPIKTFETTAKETETLLKNTYETINNQVKSYNDKRKQEISDKLNEYFEEYKLSKEINKDYLSFEELKINVTLGYTTDKGELTKGAKEEVMNKVDVIAEQLETISTMQYSEEILVEYLKDKNMTRAIKEVNDRHVTLEQVKAVNEKKEITDEQIIEKIDSLLPPKVEEEEYTLIFKVTASKDNLKKLVEFLNNGGFKYEQ